MPRRSASETRRLLDEPRLYAVLCCAMVFVYVYALLRTAWLCDDAYITYRVVDNFVNGHGLRWNVAERVQVFTHPLWMLLLSVPYFITREIYYTAIVVSLLLSTGAVFLLAQHVASTRAAGLLGIAILVSSKAFVDYSTSGLENPLTHLLLVVLVLHAKKPVKTSRDVFWRSTIAGFGLLNRLDTALLFLPVLLWSVYREGRWRDWPAVLLGFSPVALWLSFSFFYYGYPFPNTALAKLNTGIGTWELLGLAPHYFWNSLRWDPITLLTIAVAVVAAVISRSRESYGLLAGTVLYLAYIARIGGDFMSGRFFAAPLLCAVMILVTYRWGGRAFRPALAAAAVVVFGLLSPKPVLLSGPGYGRFWTNVIDEHGIADERAFYFRTAGLFNGRDGPKPTNELLTRVRAWRHCGYPIAVEGAIGYAGFAAGPGIHLVDYHALADPLLSRMPIAERDPLYDSFYEGLVGKKCPDRFRIGHFLRSIPPGYLGWVAGDERAIRDPALKRWVETVARVTRAPLLDRERLRTLIPFALGRTGHEIPPGKPERYVMPRWEEVIAAVPDSPAGYAREGVLLFHDGDTEGAETMLRKAIDRCPDDADALLNLSVVLWTRGEYEESLALCERALAIDPLSERGYGGLGHLFTKQGRFDEAIDAFRRAIELDEGFVDAYQGLAIACVLAERLDEALKAAEIVTRMSPHDPAGFRELGEIHAQMGHREEAIAAWRRAASLGSEEAERMLKRTGAD